MACLAVYVNGTVEFFELDKRAVVGSAESCDVQVVDDRVAPHHCTITLVEGGYRLAPCDKDLPTFINYAPLSEPIELQSDDIITVGSTAIGFLRYSRHELESVTLKKIMRPDAVIRPPGAQQVKDEMAHENRRLHQFEAACRALVKCTDIPMVMDVMLIAAEQIGDATYARIKLQHDSGTLTEKTRGIAPAPESENKAPSKSGVIRVTRFDEKVTSELAIAIMGRGPVTGAMWLRMDGQMRHLEHHLLRTLCDLSSVTLTSLAAR